jgi:predicted kinase|nr:hypothetical protein [Kofleriaceae bacterium]
MRRHLAVWILGAPGAGKSSLVARAGLRPSADMDGELVRLAAERGVSLIVQDAAVITALRREANARAWSGIPALRFAGEPLVFEVTGDKPVNFENAVSAGRAVGYLEVGLGVRRPLDACIAGNRARTRIVPDAAVEKSWRAFEDNVVAGTYTRILDDFVVVESGDFDLAAHLARF